MPLGEVALAECLYETRSICGLAITVDPQSTIMSKEDDAEFTRIYTTQAMLSGMGFYADALSGEDNQSTRDAVTKLQTELGLEPTGTIDDDLYVLASYGALGTARYVAMMSRHIYDTLDPAAAAHHYGKSARPAEELGFREELGTLTPMSGFEPLRRRFPRSMAVSARCLR